MQTDVQKVHIHRFHDQVAMWDGISENTVYLSGDLAVKLAEALLIVAHDIETVKFTNSKDMTREVV